MDTVCKVESTSVHSKIMVSELPESILSLIWDHVHASLRPGLKARVWADVHAELLMEFEREDAWDERNYPWVELCNGCGCEKEYAAEDIYICMSC